MAFTILTYFSVVTKIRENAPDKANDLRLVSREPQELFCPESLGRSSFVLRVRIHSLFVCVFFFLNRFLNRSIVF